MSSLKVHAGKMRGEESEGRARETRRCFARDWACADEEGDGGKGAVKEKVVVYGCEDVDGIFAAIAEAQRPWRVSRERQRVREVKRAEIPKTQQTFTGQVERNLGRHGRL